MGQYSSDDQQYPRRMVPDDGSVSLAKLASDISAVGKSVIGAADPAAAKSALAIGAIASLDSTGAARGSIAYFDGSAWQILAPPAAPSHLVINGVGLLSWSPT